MAKPVAILDHPAACLYMGIAAIDFGTRIQGDPRFGRILGSYVFVPQSKSDGHKIEVWNAREYCKLHGLQPPIVQELISAMGDA